MRNNVCPPADTHIQKKKKSTKLLYKNTFVQKFNPGIAVTKGKLRPSLHLVTLFAMRKGRGTKQALIHSSCH